MTPDDHPTVEEWIAATQACCGVDHYDDDVMAEVSKTDAATTKNDPKSDVAQPVEPEIADR